MLHFIVNPHDSNFDYEEICRDLFGTNKCLAMLESTTKTPHVHVQGELAVSEDAWKDYQRELIDQHYMRAQDPKCRPVKANNKRKADDLGFQYICKEEPKKACLYKQGFTDEDLELLHAKSNEYREQLKGELGEYLLEKCLPRAGETASELHHRYCSAAVDYYLDQDKMHPPNLKLLIRHYLGKHHAKSIPAVKTYLSNLLM